MESKKRCKGPCKELKPLGEFHYKNKARGTRQSQCKACMSNYGKKHYLDNRDVYIKRAKDRLDDLRAQNRKALEDHLKSHSCEKCGESDPRCLGAGISSAELLNRPHETILRQLQGSRVLCQNCSARQK